MVGFSSFFGSLSTLLEHARKGEKTSTSECSKFFVPLTITEEKTELKTKQSARWVNLRTSGSAPCERSGHSGLLVGDYIYVFGGFDGVQCMNDLSRFNTITHEWEEVATSGILPTGRASYAWTYSEFNKRIYVFGGSGAISDESNLGKLLEFDVVTKNWSISGVANNQAPVTGYGQSLTSYGDKLYLFGGTTGHVYSNDLYVYDQQAHTWEGPVLVSGDVPIPRYKHQAVTHGEYIYIFGGGLYDAPEGSMDIFTLHVPTLSWAKIEKASGDIPSSRIAHTAVSYEDKVLVFGGRDCNYTRQNEVYIYSIQSNSWAKYMSEDSSPSIRDFHAAAVTPNGEMFIFGGSDGIRRNNEMHRFTISYKVSPLVVLCLKEIQHNIKFYNPEIIMKLPIELRIGIKYMNPDVSVADNQKWFHLKSDVQVSYVNHKRQGMAY